MPTPHELENALSAADPIASRRPANAELDEALDELGASLVLHRQPPTTYARPGRTRRFRRPRTARGVALSGAVGLVLVGGAAAATTILTTYTREYNKGWEIQAGGPGERLLEGAPNFCKAALKLSSDITYPSGYAAWRPWVLVSEAQQPKVTTTGACGTNSPGGEGGNAEVSTGALHGWFAMSAFCAWVYDWRDAENSNNTTEASHAASIIAGALSWPAVAAEDPHPTAGPITLNKTANVLHGNSSLFGWFIPLQGAVQSDNLTRVNDLIDRHYASCDNFVPPADSDGGTVNPIVAQKSSQS